MLPVNITFEKRVNLYHMETNHLEMITMKQKMMIHTTRTRQIDIRGDERDFECKAPTNGKLPPSPTRLVEPTCLLDMTKIPQKFFFRPSIAK